MDAKKKKLQAWVWIAAALFCIAAAAAGFYLYKSNYYKSHFLPGVTVNGIDCGGLTVDEAARLLNERPIEYRLEVTGRSVDNPAENQVIGTISAADIHMRYEDAGGGLSALLLMQNGWSWPAYLFGGARQSFDLMLHTTFDEALLSECVCGWDALQEEKMSRRQSAYISGGEGDEGGYHLETGLRGTVLEPECVCDAVLEAVEANRDCLDIDAQGLYVEEGLRPEELVLQKKVDTMNRWLSARILYNWNGHEVLVDEALVAEWIDFPDEAEEPVLDEEAIAAFVSERAREYDTYGRDFEFTTCHDETITLTRDGYGWKVNKTAEAEALKELILEGSVVSREPEYVYQAYYGGEDDIGDSYVEIDLTDQHLYLHIDGEIVLDSDFVSGCVRNGDATPPGIFGVTYKARNAVLRGRTYESRVSYWMPFNGNIGMHDASWRRKFGGTIFMTNGSHGCINLPSKSAEEIFEYVEKGFPVVCYYTDGIPTVSAKPQETPKPETGGGILTGESAHTAPEG